MTGLCFRAAGTAAHAHKGLRFICLCCLTIALERAPGTKTDILKNRMLPKSSPSWQAEEGDLTTQQRRSSKCQDNQLVEVPILPNLVAETGELAARWLAEDTACIMTSIDCICVVAAY